MLGALKSRKLTSVLLILFIPLVIFESRTRNVPGYVFIAFAAPLACNLVLCLFDHIRHTRKITFGRIGFIIFHSSFLIIMAGGIVTYYTYAIGYIELAEGQEFVDHKENYTAWKQKYGARKGTGIGISVKKIVLDFWENGQIKEFKNAIHIKDGDKERDAVVDVSDSVRYGGLLINMSRYYGLAPRFTLTTDRGSTTGYVNVRNETKFNAFDIPETGYKAQASYRDIKDKRVRVKVFVDGETIEREMEKGDSIDLGSSRLELTDIKIWNGLTVVADSGRGITYTGFVLFLAGLALYYARKFRRQ